MKRMILLSLLLFIMILPVLVRSAVPGADRSSAGDPLAAQFADPPQSAWPWVYWWWLEGNVSKEGITRDLQEMKDKGIGGALLFDAGSSAYEVATRTPAGPVFLSPAWRILYQHALKEANRLGIEISLNIQSGWNPGGPMVQPQQAMIKIVWSETTVRGPLHFDEILSVSKEVRLDYYRDIAVQAYKVSATQAPTRKPIKEWLIKSVNGSFRRWKGAYPLHVLREQWPDVPGEQDVNSADLLDLTPSLDASGRLTWEVPEGEWLILRFGYTLTNARVSTCSPGWEGLSLDHLSTAALDYYWDAVVKTLVKDAGRFAGTTLTYLHTDSWEMGPANWTADFPAEFQRRRGYDLKRYLPVMAGKIVDSRERSNRFLWDFRRTIGDCIAENHYKKFAEYSHKHGLGVHPESGGPHSAPIDALQCLGANDIPMGEFWARAETHRTLDSERLFGKQPASAAHIYGKKYVNAEGFTTIGPQWERDAWDLKPVADQEFGEGVNRIFFHQFTASQLDAGLPGNEYFAGTHYNPNITWWRQSVAFNRYLARCQHLLQQGLFVADVCYYYGDDVPNFVPLKSVDPSLGPGYDYDVVNTEVILTRMSVKDGLIMLPDGMSYRLLVLPDWPMIRVDVLRKLVELVDAGATIVGPRPVKAAGLSDYPRCDHTVGEWADLLWGPCDGKSIKENAYGKGRVFCGVSLYDILLADGVPPDFEYQSRQEGSLWEYVHRKTVDSDIYFVFNRTNCWSENVCTFRVKEVVPELWLADTGETASIARYEVVDGRIKIPMRLAPYGSAFVVFRPGPAPHRLVSVLRNGVEIRAGIGDEIPPIPAADVILDRDSRLELQVWRPGVYVLADEQKRTAMVTVQDIPKTLTLAGPWEVRFAKGWGAPESVLFAELMSWTESKDPGVRYFAGTATYCKKIFLEKEGLEKIRLDLDLGQVENIAEVRLNGVDLGILWKKPFRVDISSAVRTGENLLEISVTNLWPNRLIGDQFLPKDQRFTRTNVMKFTKDSPLLEAGLLGPVQIFFAQRIRLQEELFQPR